MVPALALLLVLQDKPSMTYEKLAENLYRESRQVRGYYEEWTFEFEGDEGKTISRRWLDGPRYRQTIEFKGETHVEAGHDGNEFWVILPPSKRYVAKTAPNSAFTDKFEVVKLEDGTVHLSFKTAYDLLFSANPEFVLKSITEEVENGKKVRKVTARAERLPERYMNLTLWIDGDRWLMRRAELLGYGEEGKKIAGTFIRTVQKTDQKFDPSEFRLDQAKVAGFEKTEGPDGR